MLPDMQLIMPLKEKPPAGLQLRLHGIYRSMRESCPHYVDGNCAEKGFQPCSYSKKPVERCETLAAIIEQQKAEMGI
jgi:hypothetical protein